MHDDYAVYVNKVVKRYRQNEVLSEICMKVERGVIYGLLGASGCGKTTLLSSIVGRKKIDGGEIWVLGGKPGEAGSGVPGARVGYMPQDVALVGEFTVKDAVYYFGRILLMEDNLIAKRYRELHSLLELPPDDRYLKNCSGGQQRRVSLAASLVHKPELLIMDEPTVGVDPVLRDRIWQHLVNITNRENTSVIITTHYIEECRQANKIGLMREGRLLAEESPSRLLTLFNSETLEQVFLLLSKRQEDGRLSELADSHQPVVDEQNNSVLMNEPTGSRVSVATTVSTFEMENGSKDVLTKNKLLKRQNSLNKRRMKALLDKNWKQFYRNITGIIFLMTFPIIQVGIFMSAVGGDIKSIPIGVVNDETMTISCPDFSINGSATPTDDGSCHFSNMSCRFLTYLDHPMIRKVYYDELEKAKDAVVHGKIVGVLYMSSNFTPFLEQRIEQGKDVENETLSLSEIKVWMDMSNRQIGATLKSKLVDLYTKFQNSVFDDCNFTAGFSDLPVKINFVYGDSEEPYTVFMIPGSLITIMFFMGAIMTSQIIITDRHDGVWDRSIVAGVSSLEITITHLIIQASICIIQTGELLFVVFLIYRQEYFGSIWLIYFMVYLQGVCGMAYGFWISVISTDHSMANTVLTGIFLPMMMLSGLMWPTEGMPPSLRIFSRCLPFTMSIESLRNVSKRGWSIDNFQVINGMGVGLLWTIFFGILSVYLIKKSRKTSYFNAYTVKKNMQKEKAVYLKNVNKYYGSNLILRNLSMKVETGTIYGLLGPSGCGKTTLLKALVCTMKIDSGEIQIFGYNINYNAYPVYKVGYMPQDIALCGEFTVKDAVYYFGRLFGMEKEIIMERYNDLHKLLDLPPHDRYLRNCSGGEQRRVSLATTLVHKPALLILDEPTVGLDPLIRERIWQHLCYLTRRENTTVLITTHYVDECRDVDRIGLLRDGKLLSEESPYCLMNRVRATTIEEAFLSIAKSDTQDTLPKLPVSHKISKHKRNFKTQDTKTLRRIWSVDRHRFGALLDKNWKQFYRNITGLFFLLSLPLFEIGAFLSSVGGDVKNIPIGIVNTEIADCRNYTMNATTEPYDSFKCHLYNMSCRYLSHLEDPMLQKIYYEGLYDAKQGVKEGSISGIVYMTQNFSLNFEKRLEGREIDLETLDQSQIKVWLDMSNYQIALSLKQKLVEKYKDFQDSVLEDCGFDLKVFEQPLRIDHFYGGSNKNEPFLVFMMPGILITIQFFLGSVMTSQTIITDRHDGIWDRSIVAGVTSMEITLSHLFLQAIIVIFQTLEMMICVFVIYKMEYIGSIVIAFLLVFSQGICGMAYGFFVSVISRDHTMANVVLMGLYLPVNILSGWMWPIEGMVNGLQILARCFPFVTAIDSLRNILKKGWSLGNFAVLNGFLMGALWTFLFGVISVYIISRKR
ncbi:uncharacterized protein LOC130445863 [Diorhabda sublineata]|uniref:uncharacterized protein LOC130445863 n=1 Tax=Diorhabda sublineata TaxID=1163346 RepID=UPI0024E0E370|nr:uncharacterized protein LOC130445863 [Diorhabda sublineata]